MKTGQHVEQSFPQLNTASTLTEGHTRFSFTVAQNSRKGNISSLYNHQNKFRMWDKLNIKHVCFEWQHYGKRNKIMWLNERLLWRTDQFVVTTMQEQTLGSMPFSFLTVFGDTKNTRQLKLDCPKST